jgi:FkbM family methyltransferase
MPSFLHRVRCVLRLRTRLSVFQETPHLFHEHFRFALRRALLPEIVLPIWVTSRTQTRFYLSRDQIDDVIVHDILQRSDTLFPELNNAEPKDGVVLVIGGHHGLYLSEALHRYPDREFIVVEPHPNWCQLIEKNARANDSLDRVHIVNACLAEDCQKRILRYDSDGSWGATVHLTGKGAVTIEVESMTLSSILAGKVPAMVYCNAEGAEYSLVPELKKENIRPAMLVIHVHPEYGDSQLLRKDIQAWSYSEIDKTVSSRRPVFHYLSGSE